MVEMQIPAISQRCFYRRMTMAGGLRHPTGEAERDRGPGFDFTPRGIITFKKLS
jgi:hypothetical protein